MAEIPRSFLLWLHIKISYRLDKLMCPNSRITAGVPMIVFVFVLLYTLILIDFMHLCNPLHSGETKRRLVDCVFKHLDTKRSGHLSVNHLEGYFLCTSRNVFLYCKHTWCLCRRIFSTARTSLLGYIKYMCVLECLFFTFSPSV